MVIVDILAVIVVVNMVLVVIMMHSVSVGRSWPIVNVDARIVVGSGSGKHGNKDLGVKNNCNGRADVILKWIWK